MKNSSPPVEFQPGEFPVQVPLGIVEIDLDGRLVGTGHDGLGGLGGHEAGILIVPIHRSCPSTCGLHKLP
jgi:hypothetical protein